MKKTALKISVIIASITVIFVTLGLFGGYRWAVQNYSDAKALIDDGKYVIALEKLENIRFFTFSDQQELIQNCRDAIQAEKDEEERQQELKTKELIKKFEEEDEKNLPYVGMDLSEISKTSLGKPSDNIEHFTRTVDGVQHQGTIFKFYNSKGLIFKVECFRGKVTEIWDYRKNPQTENTKKSYSSSKNTRKSSSVSDPYNAKDYVHPDDFYYDYYDDFYDYEDAEDYWESNQ